MEREREKRDDFALKIMQGERERLKKDMLPYRLYLIYLGGTSLTFKSKISPTSLTASKVLSRSSLV